MKKIYIPSFFLLIFFALISISWTGSDPARENLSFPYNLYDYYTIYVPSASQYNNIDQEVNNNYANLGRVLFYDKILSSDGSSSCASCHQQEYSFGDNQAFSKGIDDALTTRNSPNLNDLGWQRGDGFFWNFSQKTLKDAVLQPILNPNELGLEFDELIQKLEATDYYSPLFEYAFEEEEITKEKIAVALTEFIKSMTTFFSRYDRVRGGFSSFTAQENLGWQLYVNNCMTCHTAPHFGTGKNRSVYDEDLFIFNNGLDSIYNDLGWEAPDDGSNSLITPYGIFKTPTLRNLNYSAPFMHDGRFETLEEVIDFYSRGVQNGENSFGNFYYGTELDTITGERGFLYTQNEKEAMLAFLETLNDPFLITQPKWADPFLEEPSEPLPPPEIKYNISAGPNPVDQETTIYISNSATESYDLTLINMEGKIVKEMKTISGRYILKRNNLLPGVYYLQILKDDFKYSIKLLFL